MHSYLNYLFTFIILISFLTIPTIGAGISFSDDTVYCNLKHQEIIHQHVKNKTLQKFLLKTENKKIVTITLALTLGPLGVHRLYLGTEVKVPLIYAATLGCVGILPVTDIIAILIAKDIEKYTNNPKVIMWIE